MFYIFFDSNYKIPNYDDYKSLMVAKAIPKPIETCFFDSNAFYYEHFFIGTENKEKVCHQCVRDKDPQVQNILDFINKGKNLQAKLDKLNLGMEQLRKQIAISDPNARKCPICGMKKAYHARVQGASGMSCLNCKVEYKGGGLFIFNDKSYNLDQAKKIHKMKAFT